MIQMAGTVYLTNLFRKLGMVHLKVVHQRCISSHNDGSEKWLPPIVVIFHIQPFSTSMIMGERVFSTNKKCCQPPDYIGFVWGAPFSRPGFCFQGLDFAVLPKPPIFTGKILHQKESKFLHNSREIYCYSSGTIVLVTQS